MKKKTLLNEANKFFYLSSAEKSFLRAMEHDAAFDYNEHQRHIDRKTGRILVDSELLTWVLSDKTAHTFLPSKQIHITGVLFSETFCLDVSDSTLSMYFSNSIFADAIDLSSVHINTFMLLDSQVHGGIDLQNAHLESLISISNSHIKSASDTGIAIDADGIHTGKDFFIRENSVLDGCISILDAYIGGEFSVIKSTISNITNLAINASGISIGHRFCVVEHSNVYGQINLSCASINKGCIFEDAKLNTHFEPVIFAQEATFHSSVTLNSLDIKNGGIIFCGAHITGELSIADIDIIGCNTQINADGAHISGDLQINNVASLTGGVSMCDVTVLNNVNISKSLIGNGFEAITADRAVINGDIFLDEDLRLYGETRFVGSEIKGNFSCENTILVNTFATAICFDSATIHKNLMLFPSYCAGIIDLNSSTIRCLLSIIFKDSSNSDYSVDLRNARASVLADDESSWPPKDKLHLDGFIYKRIDSESSHATEKRIGWIRKQYGYTAQPYEQLAIVFREAGLEAAAKQTLIAKCEDEHKYNSPIRKISATEYETYPLSKSFSFYAHKYFLGFGYKPYLPLAYLLLFILAATMLAQYCFISSNILPTQQNLKLYICDVNTLKMAAHGAKIKQEEAVFITFNPLLYSIDTVMPIVDLHYTDHWTPNNDIFALTFTIFTLLGWIFTTLLAIGLTGVIKR